MIKVTVRQAALARKVKNYYQLGQMLGKGPKNEMLAKRLWEGTHIPTLPTLYRVCDALNCKIEDLVRRANGKRS